MNHRLLAEIKEERQRLEQYASEARKRMTRAPEGSLRVASSGKRTMFYQRLGKKDTTGVYLRRDQRDLAEALAQKTYDKDLLKLIEAESALLDQLIASNEPTSALDQAFDDMPAVRKDLVLPYRQSDDVMRITWPLHAYPRLNPPEPEKALTTNRGEAVRSKSEVIIANILNELGVPYRYEQELKLSRTTTVHPDFTVLRLSDRKVLVWEHFGMMDDPDYCTNTLRKIQAYQKAGYIQGANMIMTFESSTAPLDARAIKRLVQELLL